MSLASDALRDTPDVLVLGGGAAGLVAAAVAARAGCRVTLVYRGEGATGQSSGAIDVADAARLRAPGPDFDFFAPGPSWAGAAAMLASERPRHPYARLGGAALGRMSEALAFLASLVPELSLAAREDGANHIALSELGTPKACAWLPSAACVDLGGAGVPRALYLADFEDLSSCSAPSAAKTLSWLASLRGHALAPRAITLPSLPGAPRVFESGRSLAAWLDDDEAQDALVAVVAQVVADLDPAPELLLVPAVLGLRDAVRVRARVAAAAGCPVHEMLALPASAPGARLVQALRQGAAREGVTLVEGEVLPAEPSTAARTQAAGAMRLGSLRVRDESGERTLRPGSVVLATGRFLGGGLSREGVARETIFGLPVVTEGEVVHDRAMSELTGEAPEREHAIFRAGIAFDHGLRPLDARGVPLAQNLFAAGSILEGYDPARDGSGLGVCALTGLLAGERAAAAARADGAGDSSRGVPDAGSER